MDAPVLGAAGLGCDARLVREWARVSCRGANANGGTPEGIEVQKGGGPEVYTFAKNGVTSVVLRLLPGTELEAKLTWSDASAFPLRIAWPSGEAKRPWPIGRFDGAPEQPVDTPKRRGACYCYKLSLGGAGAGAGEDLCAGVAADAFAPECLRTHDPTVGSRESCAGLLECQWFAPSGYAECLPGEVHTGVCPSCRCAVECGPGKPACPKGTECTENMGRANSVCMEP